jgi:MFS family permease
MLAAQAWNSVFFLYMLAFPLAILCWVVLDEPQPALLDKSPSPKGNAYKTEQSLAPASDKPFLAIVTPLVIVTLIGGTLFYVWLVQGGLAFRELGINSPELQGRIFAISHMAVVAGALLYSFSGRFLTPQAQTSLMLAMMGVGLILIGISTSQATIMAALAVQQVAAGMSVLALMSWAHAILPEAVRGRGMGAWAAAFFAGQFVSPLLFGAAGTFLPGVLHRFIMFGSIGVTIAAILFILSFRFSSHRYSS